MLLPVDPQLYAAFVSVMLVMALMPGPAVLFAIATGARHGRRAAAVGVAGMNTASLVWFLAAALGLTGLAAAFPRAFEILRYAGVAYVTWLGVKATWGAWRGEAAAAEQGAAPSSRSFRDGFLVQITNPKALLFITAILPPFVDPDRPLAPQMALFAATAIAFDLAAMMSYGLGGAALAARMTEPRFRRGFALFTGILLLLAAVLILIRR